MVWPLVKWSNSRYYNTACEYYVLIYWVGRLDEKIFGSRLGRTDQAERGPCVLTESQMFSSSAWPHSVNKHFIIWPLFCFIFIFFLVKRSRAEAVCISCRAVRVFATLSLWCVQPSYGTFFCYGFPRKLLAGRGRTGHMINKIIRKKCGYF